MSPASVFHPHFSKWTPTDWTALATAAYAVIALVAAVFVYLQVRELQRTRAEQARPFVVVDIQPSPVWANMLNLVVENIGTTLAREVTMSFDPPLQSSIRDSKVASSTLVTEGIPFLPPGRRIIATFDAAHERINTSLPMRYVATVRFQDFAGRPQPDLSYVIDISYMFGISFLTEYGTHHAAKALQEISKTLSKPMSADGRFRVWTRDEDENLDRDRIEHEMMGRWGTLGTASPSDFVMWLGRNMWVRSAVRYVRSRREQRHP